MLTRKRGGSRLLLALLATVAGVAIIIVGVGEEARGQAIINNGVVELGVVAEGALNVAGGPASCGGTTTVGLRFMPTNCESTAPGCLCEGWGVAYDGSVSGHCNQSAACPGGSLAGCVQASTASTSNVVCTVGALQVEHDYVPSAAPELYQVDVTITNTGAVPVSDVLYRRVMDWDVEPTAFSEFVTIDGVGAVPTELVFFNDNGFSSADPLVAPSPMIGACGAPTTYFVDCGPADHGALFDFDFGGLAPGASLDFQVFYGAAKDESTALSALSTVGAQVWSLGQCNNAIDVSCSEITGSPNTFIFGFGGLTVPPPKPPVIPVSCEAHGIRIVEQDSLGNNVVSTYATSTASATASPTGVSSPSPILTPPSPSSAHADAAEHGFAASLLGGQLAVSAKTIFSQCDVLAEMNGNFTDWLTEAYGRAGIEDLHVSSPFIAGSFDVEALDFEMDAYGTPTATDAWWACDLAEAGAFAPPSIAAVCIPPAFISIGLAGPVQIQAPRVELVAGGPSQWTYEGSALRITATTGTDTVVIDVGFVRVTVTGAAPSSPFPTYVPNTGCLTSLCT